MEGLNYGTWRQECDGNAVTWRYGDDDDYVTGTVRVIVDQPRSKFPDVVWVYCPEVVVNHAYGPVLKSCDTLEAAKLAVEEFHASVYRRVARVR